MAGETQPAALGVTDPESLHRWGLLLGLLTHEAPSYGPRAAATLTGVGYSMRTTGRILLPESSEHHLLTVLEVRMAAHPGAFDPDDPVETLGDLAEYVGVELTRDGDWLTLATGEDGDPKWSDQAAAFYRGLEGWVTSGMVELVGEDGSRWGYRYSPEGLDETGDYGWGDAPTETPRPPTAPAAGSPTGVAPSALPPMQHPSGLSAPTDDPTGPPGGSRVLLMTLLLVVGVVLIIGVAMLGAGLL